ncbi:bone morphogenetic protein 10-like [Ruditapes philippinarum]|uniref:bone morphogenetic protein 10-like n=1 Tax=Ruditapes philippinarum TaxID=129788 RepID=UPI00295B7D44|nr:bone morphogenetic protein 10-like [Ruditapes philippinarum]
MHHLLLIFGLRFLILSKVLWARPVMLNLNSGSGFNLELESAEDFSETTDIDSWMNDNVRISKFIGNRLYEENISGFRPTLAGTGNRAMINMSLTPEYMLELYDKLSKGSPAAHSSNIVRSFKNIPQHEQKSSGTPVNFRNYRVHSLVFDISALDRSESINSAELRLYTLITRDQQSYMGVNRVVSIYEIVDIGQPVDADQIKYRFITSKYIYGVENSWESFDVTEVLKSSLQLGLKIERLEVRIQTVFMDSGRDNMDINANPNDIKQPLLVVYSNDKSIEHEHDVETHELLLHGLDSNVNNKGTTHAGREIESRYVYNGQQVSHSRSKRSRGSKSSFCKRRPLFVNFEDIGWHTWIIAPRGFQAYQCAGKCTFPLSEHWSPSKHAVIQTLMHSYHPKRAARSCCVPTKLDPISILYIDEQGVVTYKYRYDGMVVASCGCQ